MLFIILSSILIGATCGPIGCIILWKRYANLADSIIHSIIFAAAINEWTNINISCCIILSCISILSIKKISKSKKYGTTEVLCVASTLLTSISIIFSKNAEKSVTTLLFGDILLVNQKDAYLITYMLIILYAYLYFYYNKLIRFIINPDVAKLADPYIDIYNNLFFLIALLIISFIIPVFGAMIISSLLIVPAMIGRVLSSTPNHMILFSIMFSIIIVFVGLSIAYIYDWPTGPTIGLTSASILAFTNYAKYIFIRKN